MGKNTKIEWATDTFNAWTGCQKVSPGCKHCYAEAWSNRYGRDFSARIIASQAKWKEPLRWNREAAASGVRRRVFTNSLADVFEDRHELVEPRARLFRLIIDTPHLDWLLLTKRPENASKLWGMAHGRARPWSNESPVWASNVWLGTSVEDQQRADERIPHLLKVPAAVRFLSVEPLLGPVVLNCGGGGLQGCCHPIQECVRGWGAPDRGGCSGNWPDWVIVGGESGPGARPCDVAWIRSVVAQCQAAGVPAFVKQLGARPYCGSAGAGFGHDWPSGKNRHWRWDDSTTTPLTVYEQFDPKGGDPAEWPADLHVREFPAPRAEVPQRVEPATGGEAS